MVLFCVLLGLPGFNTRAHAEDLFHRLGLGFRASFDHAVGDMSREDALIEAHGGRIVEDGVSGRALRLEKGEHLVLDAGKVIGSTPEGTLMFWARPHWDYYQQEDGRLTSHTFMSFAWDDPSRSYFVLSDGWWEPAGSPYTYFVLSNQEYAHVRSRVRYGDGQWVLLAVGWRTGAAGELTLHVNGEPPSKWEGKPLRGMVPGKMLYLGGDKGTTLQVGRWAECDFDELMVFSRKLSDDEIGEVMRRTDPRWEEHARPWLAELPKLVYNPARDANGVILEARVIFDEGTGWMTDAGARETIRRIRRAGFNVYVPCVWHGKGTRYPSPLAAAEPGMTFSGGDPLARLIQVARAENIEVHPWFCVSLRERDFMKEFYDEGTPAKAFDLHKPGFRRFIVDLMLDVVRRYDVHGINLDYVRTQGICTSMYCQEDYRSKTGKDLLTELVARQPSRALHVNVQRWQDDAVEDIVREFSIKARGLKRDIILSVDGYPVPDSSFIPASQEGRQEIRWADLGLIDAVFCMDYSQSPDFHTFGDIVASIKTGVKPLLLVGNYDGRTGSGILPREPRLVANVIAYAQRRWPGGVGLYIYSLMGDPQIEALKMGPFREPARPVWQRK
jgi:hypothetical protein